MLTSLLRLASFYGLLNALDVLGAQEGRIPSTVTSDHKLRPHMPPGLRARFQGRELDKEQTDGKDSGETLRPATLDIHPPESLSIAIQASLSMFA
ncbi:hypothetical protein K466DRAFT_602179 [Polyporus arcularius HHB13444]|uniref:Uncharacterized protein n=1 Tax=Polyporus arcularius HHB13444 TaxID=1314778 RepID=A0A5C3P6L1_9APHY|nr:hypothetical protein K466DRAFT_602179 [Polyporus arcularius HHB13444]